ncbi:MAG: LysR family transcriptional regulator, partial [Pseudorhodoplanes sp.]
MDFRELRYFSFVAELKSFSRAAAQLRIAQPALSRCVRQLEEELGVTLFDRHGRGVTLTEAGQTLYERAQTLLQGLRQARDDVATTSAVPRGSLRLAVPPAAGQGLAPSLIERYHALYPQVSIHIHEGVS